MVGGAWPFLVGGVICQVNSVNERDLGVVARGLVQFMYQTSPSYTDCWRHSQRKPQAITGL